MATILHKKINGEWQEQYVESRYVHDHIKSGWLTSQDDSVTKEEADTNNSGKLSADEVRAAAKEAGIEGYDKKRIATLEAELWPSSK